MSDEGMNLRREVLGEDFIARYAWGEIWTRPGLDRRTRSAGARPMIPAFGRTGW